MGTFTEHFTHVQSIDPLQFVAWKKGTAELVARRPVSREEAIRVLEEHELREGFARSVLNKIAGPEVPKGRDGSDYSDS